MSSSASLTPSSRTSASTPVDVDQPVENEVPQRQSPRPRGRAWLDLHMPDCVAMTAVREASKRELAPYTSGVVADFAACLASRDVNLFKALFGLQACNTVSFANCDAVATSRLWRGNQGSEGHAATNKAYFPRMLDYLEFLHERPELQTTAEQLASELNLPIDEVEHRLDWVAGPIYWVHPLGVVRFLQQKRAVRDALNPTDDGIKVITDLDACYELATQSEHEEAHREKRRRRNRYVAHHLSVADCTRYEAALQELRSLQIWLLSAEAWIPKAICKSGELRALLTSVEAEHKYLELRCPYDKGAGSIADLPDREHLSRLFDYWWSMAEFDRKRGHTGVMNLCAFKNMSHTLCRGDSELTQGYSSKILIDAQGFSSKVVRCSPIPVRLFITMSRDGKVKKNNHRDYYTRLPSRSPDDCPVVAEAVMLFYRHDYLGVEAPNFAAVEYSRSPPEITRPWYADRWYANVGSFKRTSILAAPYTISAMYQSWSFAFKKSDISTLHVMHLPRQLETFILSIDGFSRDEKAVIAKWREQIDSQSMSYEHVNDLNLLARIADFEGLSDYKAWWTQMEPPTVLVASILSVFDGELAKASQRCARSKTLKDEFESQLQNDTCAVHTLRYIEALRRILVQAAPFLKDAHPRFPPFCQHPLFNGRLYKDWHTIQTTHCKTMDEVFAVTAGSSMSPGGGSFHFKVEHDLSGWSITAMAAGEKHGRFSRHARNLQALVNKYTPMPLEMPSRCADASQSTQILGTKIELVRQDLVQIHGLLERQEEGLSNLWSVLLSKEDATPSISRAPVTPVVASQPTFDLSVVDGQGEIAGALRDRALQAEISYIKPMHVIN